MAHTFVYLRGQPATGKITVARILEKQLGWKVFWFHELKNAVYDIVREHRIPRLMDELTQPILKFLLERGDNLIYVRPSPDKETVENIQALLSNFPDYRVVVIRLTASYDTLVQRATARQDEYRISTQEALDQYIQSRSETPVSGEYCIDTDGRSPEAIAQEIVQLIGVHD
jgi:dephospho-CoA kinase